MSYIVRYEYTTYSTANVLHHAPGGVPDVITALFMRFKINIIEPHKSTSGTLPMRYNRSACRMTYVVFFLQMELDAQ